MNENKAAQINTLTNEDNEYHEGIIIMDLCNNAIKMDKFVRYR